MKYIEVDFQEITTQKIATIKENPELEKLIFKEESPKYESEDTLLGPRYKLIPCDIRETDVLHERLSQAGVDFEAATLVLTECVLCYMENADSAKILNFLTKSFEQNVAIVNFEMIKPNDAFGTTMLDNLESRGCQLLGLKDCPDEEAQVTRMLDAGFKKAHCENMLRIHNGKLDETEKARIEKIELFDEFEEWDLIQSHYCICVGSRFLDGSELTF